MRSTVIRLLIFFVGAIAVIAATIPFEQVGLDESPFVTVFSSIGIPFAADIMNFVIITALLSAGNSGLFSCARMLYSLADEGHAPRALKKLTRRGIPMIALSVSMLGGLASLISSVVAPETVYLALVSVAGFAVVGVWMSITASHFFHRRSFVERRRCRCSSLQGPAVPAGADPGLSLCLVSLIGIAYRPEPGSSALFRSRVCWRLLRLLLLQVRTQDAHRPAVLTPSSTIIDSAWRPGTFVPGREVVQRINHEFTRSDAIRAQFGPERR